MYGRVQKRNGYQIGADRINLKNKIGLGRGRKNGTNQDTIYRTKG